MNRTNQEKLNLIFYPDRLGVVILLITTLFICILTLPASAAEQWTPDGIILHTGGCEGPAGVLNPSSNRFHYIVQKDGTVLRNIQEEKPVIHVGSRFNNRSISVFVEGSFDSGDYTRNITNPRQMPKKQEKALQGLLFKLMGQYNIPLSQVERHVDHDIYLNCAGSNFPYFELLYNMSSIMIKKSGKLTLEEICREKGIAYPLQNALLIVDKSAYLLKIYSGDTYLKSYNIGLSNKPTGDKRKKGDRRTPTGVFYITEKYPMRAWMEFNYPGETHAKKALEEKLIDEEEFEIIVEVDRSGGVPWHESVMGNDVGIHAGGFTYGNMRKDYTAGCIGMEDPEAYELYRAILPGAAVSITE